jgi:hypothetical protein
MPQCQTVSQPQTVILHPSPADVIYILHSHEFQSTLSDPHNSESIILCL